MARSKSTVMILSLLVVAFLALSVNAANSPVPAQRVVNPHLIKATQYAFPDESNFTVTTGRDAPRASLGVADANSVAIGVKVGDTWYDYQHNGRMPRMIDWGYDEAEAKLLIHFSWMDMATSAFENRKSAYNVYYTETGLFLGETGIQADGDYAGYVGIDVTEDNRAVVGCHNNQGSGYQSQFYYDFGPGWAFFGSNSRVEDSVSAYVTGQNWVTDSLYSVIWPDFKYQDVPGQTPVTHVFSQESQNEAADPQAVAYFRKVGANETGDWDYPPYVVDTVYDIAQSVACSRTDGKMALVWIANRPDDGDDDTASSNTGQQYVQWDNDIFYQISNDYGATFSPRVNLTKNVDGVDGYRPYTDLAVLIDGANNLHIAYSARFWPADANTGGDAGLYRGRMFCWGENLGTGGYDTNGDALIRTAANLEWDQTTCTPGAWNLQGSKMSISECNGKLYYLYVQFNDGPKGIYEDCAERAFAGGGDITGAANGELYLVVSDDGGLTWDAARNITNTRTPHCDSATGLGGRCNAEHWPSMARFGTNIVGTDMSGAFETDLGTGQGDGYFLDIQFIDDADPGGIVQDEGTWQQADVRWMRVACVDPVPTAIFNPSWTDIGFPAWGKHGVPKDTALTIENSGNTALTYTVAVTELTGPTGWLTHSGLGTGVGSGVNNTITGTVTLNTGGIVNTPTTIVYLHGWMVFGGGNSTTGPDSLEIEYWVTDTLIQPVWDTIYAGGEASACLALVVGNNGNFGNQGAGHVNLDYFDYGDCDDVEGTDDTIPGTSEIYIFDGSPIICWMDATDTVRCNWSMFGDGYLSENGFFPLGSVPVAEETDYSIYEAQFTTRDTGIMLEKTWIAPKTGECNWMIEVLKIYSLDGETHAGLAIGEGMDWDVPADSGSYNNSGFDDGLNLIYQVGSEFDDDDYECQDNNLRYGGIGTYGVEVNGSMGDLYGAYTRDNSQQVYPLGSFAPDSVWKYMAVDGYSISDSTDADLHAVTSFLWDFDLTPTDTVKVYKCLVTGKDGEQAFLDDVQACYDWGAAQGIFPPAGCCKIRGDIDHSGVLPIDISDLVWLVDYMFTGGPEPPCWDEGDVDASGAAPIDISDLVWLVDYMFTGGPPPPGC